MLGSFIRILFYFAALAVATLIVWYLLQAPGGVTINFADREFFFEPLVFVGLLIAFIVGFLILVKLIGFIVAVFRFIIGDETAVSRYFDRSRHRRGLDALTEGWALLNAGDAGRALSKAEKADRLLDRPSLTRLLLARAAEETGDTALAKKHYRALAEDKDTAMAGVRGLMDLALREGENDKAMKLAESGLKLKPKDPHALETLYTLQSQRFDWAGARRTLAQQRKAGYLEKPEAQRRDAMLALAQAEDAEEQGHEEEARKLALEAARTDPGNPEAAATAARLLVKDGSKKQASKLLIEAWKRNPSPQLAAAYAALEPDESPAERRRRFEKLISGKPDHPESRFTEAELALTTDDFRGARKAISDLRETEPSARSCAIMAAVARGEGAPETEVRGWLARAIGAPRGSAPDTLIGHAAMLPLLMGEDRRPEDATVVNGANSADREAAGSGGDGAARPDKGGTDDAKAADAAAKSSGSSAGTADTTNTGSTADTGPRAASAH